MAKVGVISKHFEPKIESVQQLRKVVIAKRRIMSGRITGMVVYTVKDCDYFLLSLLQIGILCCSHD